LLNKANGITPMTIHVQIAHLRLFAEKKLNEKGLEPIAHVWQSRKKRTGPSDRAIIAFLVATKPFKKCDEQQKHFLEDLLLYICKGYMPLSTGKNVWQASEVSVTPMPLCFISFSLFSCGRSVANHCQEDHGASCLLNLAFATIVYTNFDLWMSRGNVDILFW
jgi:hypothetical protein